MNNITYYNKNAKEYIEKTLDLDMSKCYEKFERYLKSGHILDLGCGSGRDSLYFYNKDYQVTSLDGSIEMVKASRKTLTTPVYHCSFKAYESQELYDGIWASASLLHVAKNDLKDIIQKYIDLLKEGGIFYLSFKNYHEDFHYKGRSFTCLTLKSADLIIKDLLRVEVLELVESKSVQKDNMTWINIVLKKCINDTLSL